MANIYINKKEKQAIIDASEQVRNVLESCSAPEGSWVLEMLNNTIGGLNSILNKL